MEQANSYHKVVIKDGTDNEVDLNQTEECRQWVRNHVVTIGDQSALPDQLLLIWYATKGNGQWQHQDGGPMPGIPTRVLEANRDSQGNPWGAKIKVIYNIDKYSCSDRGRCVYIGHNGEPRHIIIQ